MIPASMPIIVLNFRISRLEFERGECVVSNHRNRGNDSSVSMQPFPACSIWAATWFQLFTTEYLDKRHAVLETGNGSLESQYRFESTI